MRSRGACGWLCRAEHKHPVSQWDGTVYCWTRGSRCISALALGSDHSSRGSAVFFRSHLFLVSDLTKRVNVSSSDLLSSLLDSFFFFFQYSWFFFEVLIKSMAQHLIENSKVKVCHFLSRFAWQFSRESLFHCSQQLLMLSGWQSRYYSRGFLSIKAF